MKIIIVDVIGLTYDGNTLNYRGLGGSESAIIYMAKELHDIGFDVTVLNNCKDSKSAEGIYDGVKYVDLSNIHNPSFNIPPADIFISSRTVAPLVPEKYANQFSIPSTLFNKLKTDKTHKILWMHDTFCQGDNLVEELVVDGYINEIFTLSDFHTTYVANCHHGRRRNFEVLKNKIFMTRNGAKKHLDSDITKKDINHFVYNASLTKGMVPLVNRIWPMVKQHIPLAKLTVIGGYYRFRDNAAPDAQEVDWRKLIERQDLKNLSINFTGIITQKEIAEILSNASFMIYPGAFPETFGISALESLLYNTPLITTRFGALEETAIDGACYKIDYAIEPNNMFMDIDPNRQAQIFAQETINAYRNTYLHAQKMQYCNIVHDIVGWDTVALQWKQHFFKKFGKYLSIDEYRKVDRINKRVQKVFGRRYTNTEEFPVATTNEKLHIKVVTPFFNAAGYIADCILSVTSQDYSNYTHYIINDASTDESDEKVLAVLETLPEDIRKKIIYRKNGTNMGAVYNQMSVIENSDENEIVMMLDGDDKLINDNNIFNFYNDFYLTNKAEFTYGSCWSMVDNIPLIAQPYPQTVKTEKSYRKHKFAWNMPYTHLRTFSGKLTHDLDLSSFKDSEGNWLRAGGDTAIFYELIERAVPDKVYAIPDIVYMYNDINPLNDYKVNAKEQNKTATLVMEKYMKTVNKKKILIAVPTAKYIETETFKSIYDLEVPEGYETTFQYFFGYQIDQVRNLIAHWAKEFDYLFSVDSDIVLPKDCLIKMLGHNVDIVSGVYMQRKPDVQIIEIYRKFNNGVNNVDFNVLQPAGLYEIDGCGFGCVLINSDVIRKIPYPHFVYHSALDHRYTVSEDVDFCKKAQSIGAKLYVDSSIVCNHIGATTFRPVSTAPNLVQKRLQELHDRDLLPRDHVEYLITMKNDGTVPKVVYDIGACVLHWTNKAKEVWPNAEFIAFEAMEDTKFLYEKVGMRHSAGTVLLDVDNVLVDFYENVEHPGGNSHFIENPEVNPEAEQYFNKNHLKQRLAKTLDTIMLENKFPKPDLIKMDVQGAEFAVLTGATQALSQCKDLILELQHVEYNKGAPHADEVIKYLDSIGFKLVKVFCRTNFDGDYHFTRV